MSSTEQRPLPRPALWLMLVALAGVLAFGAAELLVRIVPGPWTNSFFYRYDPELGTWHLANFRGNNRSTDYDVRGISFNAFGMRDRERALKKPNGVTRIAFLGDSIIEGVQVGNEEVITAQMERILGPSVEVLNAGVSGFGTLQEYLAYKSRMRPFAPDIVILGLYTGNDMRNNSMELETLYNGDASDRPFMRTTANGWELVPLPSKSASQSPITLFFKRHFTLYRFLWFVKQRIAGMTQSSRPREEVASTHTVQATESANVYLTRLFTPPTTEPFISAWETTEYLISLLRREVEADGATFVLVLIPDPVILRENPKAELETYFSESLPNTYDAEYPQKRLAAFARNEGIAYFDLTSALKAYRDEQRLAPPYFSFAHDGHWSPLGHKVAAEAIAAYIKSAYRIGQ